MSSNSELIKFEKVINYIRSLNGTIVTILSTEEWSLGNLSQSKFVGSIEVILVPRLPLSIKSVHYRLDKKVLQSLCFSIPEIITNLRNANVKKSDQVFIIYHSFKRTNSLGIHSVLETFFGISAKTIRIQKTLLSDIDFIAHLRQSRIKFNLRDNNLFRIFLHVISKKLNFLLALNLIGLLLKWNLIKLMKYFLNTREVFLAFNNYEYSSILKNFRYVKVFKVKNPEIDYQQQSSTFKSIPKKLIFFTSGVFKYNNLLHINHEMELIYKVKQYCKENQLEFFVKPKIGELVNHENNLLDSEILDSNLDIFQLDEYFFTICSIGSSVLPKSILRNNPTFYFEIEKHGLNRPLYKELRKEFQDLDLNNFFNGPINESQMLKLNRLNYRFIEKYLINSFTSLEEVFYNLNENI
jgi:hypothetical protein